MTEDQKQPWWKSVPGVLTAATGFVAALSGLVAGLNQLGAFRREPASAPAVSPVPALRDSIAGESSSAGTGRSGSDTSPATGAPPTTPSSPAPSHPRPPASAPAGAPPTRPDTGPERSAAGSLLPKGTTLDLEVRGRICAPSTGQKRFTARLTSPAKSGGAAVLPVGTTAVLHLRRGESSQSPEVRLDSLVRTDLTVSVPSSSARVRRGADGRACLRSGARITATLGGPLTLPR